MTEKDVKLQVLGQVIAQHRKAEIIADSGLDVERLSVLVSEIHQLAKASGLRIEVLATPDMKHADYRTTTLRVLSEQNCVLSRTLR